MSRYIFKSKKWYARFWPPERRKVKTMQAIIDWLSPQIEQRVQREVLNQLIYGTKKGKSK